MSRAAAAAVACALACAGCEGQVGTFQLSIVTAPGADPMADVQRVRLTLSNPPTVVESERDGSGNFSLELEAVAEGQSGRVSLEGFDGDGGLVAVGRTALLPISSIDANIAIYVAPPDSVGQAPVELDVARADMASAGLSFGALWAGGTGADGTPTDAMTIYNVYAHDLQIGLELPEPRASMTAVPGFFSFVYLFGGTDAAGEPTADFLRFDTSATPNGTYAQLGTDDAFARAGAGAAPIATEIFLLGGNPGVILDGTTAAARDAQTPPLDGPLATLVFDDIEITTLVAGDGVGTSGAVVVRNGLFTDATDVPEEVRRTGHAVVGLRTGDGLILGGSIAGVPTASAVRFRSAAGTFAVIDDFLAVPRNGPAVTRAENLLVVAGGTDADGNVVDTVEVFDATSLQPISTHAMVVPRTRASAVAFDNGQVAIAGGVDEDGAPTAVIELYTP